MLDFEFSFDEFFEIVKALVKCGVDYSDHIISKNKKSSKEWYDIGGIINELFPNLFCNLLDKNEEYFNDKEIYNYLA